MPAFPAPPDQPVAIFVHVHYPDIWREMGAVIAARFDCPFHLVLTHSAPADDIAVPDTPHLVSVTKLATENRGRDIRPFLAAVAGMPAFDIGLKLHTKKSPQRPDGAGWRSAILDSLVPPAGTAGVAARLRADPRIGLVAPDLFCFSVDPWILLNAPGMIRVMTARGLDLNEADLDDAYFAAGSMFWFRRTAVASLAEPRVLDLFEPERGQLDGTVAHATERLFPVEAHRLGLLSLAMPALMESDPQDTLDQMKGLARRHADILSRYFPNPGEGTPPWAGPAVRPPS